MKSCWRKPVKNETWFRQARLKRNWFQIDVAREVGIPVHVLGRIECGEFVANEKEIKAELRAFYRRAKPPRRDPNPWRGQAYPTGYQLRMAMLAQGLTYHALASRLRNKEGKRRSDWYWWTYMQADIDAETGSPKQLPQEWATVASRFVDMTAREVLGAQAPGKTLEEFSK